MNERIPGARLLTPLLVVVLILLALRLLPLPLEHVFVTIFTAVLLAAAVAPAADALEKYHIPRGVTVLAMYLVGLLVLAGVIALIVPLVSGEVTALQDRLPRYNEDLRRLIERIAPEQADRLDSDAIADKIFDQLGGQIGRATDFAVTLSSLVVRIIIILVMSYFMAVEADFAERVVTRFTPPAHRARVHRIMSSVGNRLGHWARAQLLLALYFGVLFGVGLRLAGVPYAVTLGVIGGVIEIIPYIGGFITLLLAVLIAASKAPILVVWVVVWYTFVVQTQAHVLAPVLMGRVVGMHPLVVVIALFVGVEALGFYGALLAVPIAVVLQALLDEFYSFSSLDSSSSPLDPPSAGKAASPDDSPDAVAAAEAGGPGDPPAGSFSVAAND
jgi:predicted PurR-regulated permease PerM